MPAAVTMDAELALHSFEGSEKKMEIVFTPEDGSDISEMGWNDGLRTYRRAHWDAVVGLLNGCILLEDVQEHFDVYLISESSLFVYRDRVVILTCGTTTLLKTLQAILDAGEKVGLKVSYFQYSRKNFLFPEEQEYPHTSFDQEVDYMSQVFDDGKPHVSHPPALPLVGTLSSPPPAFPLMALPVSQKWGWLTFAFLP